MDRTGPRRDERRRARGVGARAPSELGNEVPQGGAAGRGGRCRGARAHSPGPLPGRPAPRAGGAFVAGRGGGGRGGASFFSPGGRGATSRPPPEKDGACWQGSSPASN